MIKHAGCTQKHVQVNSSAKQLLTEPETSTLGGCSMTSCQCDSCIIVHVHIRVFSELLQAGLDCLLNNVWFCQRQKSLQHLSNIKPDIWHLQVNKSTIKQTATVCAHDNTYKTGVGGFPQPHKHVSCSMLHNVLQQR